MTTEQFIENRMREERLRNPRRYSPDPNEAPKGFVPVKKSDFADPMGGSVPNLCNNCHARNLCIANIDNWCAKNPCMSHSRKDAMGVVFRSI